MEQNIVLISENELWDLTALYQDKRTSCEYRPGHQKFVRDYR